MFDQGFAKNENKKNLIVIIYDISNSKRRNRLGKFLLGYGIRIQNSSFECYLDNKVYRKLMKEIKFYIKKEDLTLQRKLKNMNL